MSSAITLKILSSLIEKGDVHRGSAVSADLAIVAVTVPNGLDQLITKLEVGKFVLVLVFEQYTNAKELKVIVSVCGNTMCYLNFCEAVVQVLKVESCEVKRKESGNAARRNPTNNYMYLWTKYKLSLQVCGFKIIRVTVSVIQRKTKKKVWKFVHYIILFVTTCERRELLKHHRKRRK